MTRVLVASDGACPVAALRHASAMAGSTGEVVIAAVVVVPHAVSIEAAPEGAVAAACAMLEQGERLADAPAVDTRVLRSRSFSEGVLGVLAAERFDALVVELPPSTRNGARAQLEVLLDKAPAEFVLVRAARPDAGRGPLSP